MKFLLLMCALFTVFGLTGCGLSQQMSKDCGGDGKAVCQALFGTDTDEQAQLNDVDRRLDTVEARVEDLRTQFNIALVSIEGSQASLQALQESIEQAYAAIQSNQEATEAEQAAAQAQLQALFNQYSTIEASIVGLQTQATVAQAQLTALYAQDTIVDYIDPCGTASGQYNEIVMRTRSGKLIAYFEHASTRFLTLLGPGTYVTTDAPKGCVFSVNAANQVCDNLGCR